MNTDDPIKRFVEKDSDIEEMSPMDPPEAFAPSTVDPVPYEDMYPLLQKLMDEHKVFVKVLDNFEEALTEWQQNKWIFNDNINKSFKELFSFLDVNTPEHNKKEEKQLFPLLHKRLIESGEHSGDEVPKTGVDIMEAEHIQVAQLGSLCLNFLGLGSRMQDRTSRELTFEYAYNQGKEIVEIMRLHIYREDETLFPLAMKLISKDEFENL
ncbi:MAG TPA: hemerythrin domain-containing protein [Ignavibacteria bacterium]|nr:hemerythrin domain-containing protein [Ignavibacteria bacterium]